MGKDAPARQGAKTAIGLVGRPITFVRETEGTENLVTGVAVPGEDSQALTAFLTKVSRRMVDGTRVKASDMMYLIDAISFEEAYGSGAEPTTDDKIQDGSEDLAIQAVFSVVSGEQFALHKAVVRR